jgi:hypothetical protein
MLAITANGLSSIRRASRALLGFFIFMSVVFLLGTLNQVTHPFPPGTRTLAGVVFQGTAITGRTRAARRTGFGRLGPGLITCQL